MANEFFRELLTNDINESDVMLVGIPYDLGCSCGKGASMAPSVIRELSSYLPPFTADGKSLKNLKMYDAGDISLFEEIENNLSLYKSPNRSPLTASGLTEHEHSIHKIKIILNNTSFF